MSDDGPAIATLRKDPNRDRPRSVVQQLPITAFAEWDRVYQIRSVLRSFEGNNVDFSQAAMLVDAMLRDDRIFGVSATRVGALIGSAVDFKPGNKKAKAKTIAELLGDTDESDGLWNQICSPAAVGQMVFWGQHLGIAIGELVWKTTPDSWLPTLRVWHPQFLRWDHQLGIYKLRTRDGFINLPNPEENPRMDGKWVLWTPYGYRDGWRQALLRPLAMLYLCRQWAYRDWAAYNEKHGQPTDLAKVPESAPPEEKQLFADQLANRGANAAIMLPQGASEQESYGLSILEPTSRSFESFDRQIAKLETDIAIAILGQNLTTEVKEGSRAAAQVHDSVRLDKRKEDARIGPVLRTQVLSHWAEHNFGDPTLAPRVCYLVDDPEDEKQEVETYEGVGKACKALMEVGIPVDGEAMAERYGVPLKREEPAAEGDRTEGVLAPDQPAAPSLVLTPSAVGAIATVNEARAAVGLGPKLTVTGAPDPDGELTVAEFTEKHAGTVAAAAKAEAGTDPNAEPADAEAANDQAIGAEDEDEDEEADE